VGGTKKQPTKGKRGVIFETTNIRGGGKKNGEKGGSLPRVELYLQQLRNASTAFEDNHMTVRKERGAKRQRKPTVK